MAEESYWDNDDKASEVGGTCPNCGTKGEGFLKVYFREGKARSLRRPIHSMHINCGKCGIIDLMGGTHRFSVAEIRTYLWKTSTTLGSDLARELAN